MQIKINGIDYLYFNEVSINTALAAVASTFTFTAYFNPENQQHRELFRPLSYHKVEFFDDPVSISAKPRLLSTGTITDISFSSESTRSLVQLSGYSLPGVLEDCQIPPSSYPLEKNGLSLETITRNLIKPFGLNLIVYDSVAKLAAEPITKAVATPEENIKNYICKIANQKNIIVSHDIHGNLIMFRPVISSAVKLSLRPDTCISMSLDISGRGLHSDLTSIRQPQRGNGSNPFDNDYSGLSDDPDFPDPSGTKKSFKIGSIDTVKNPLVKVFRPSVDVLSSGTFYNVTTAAKNRRAAELQNIRVNFSLDYWPNASVGDIVEIYNPEIYIYTPVKMVLDTTTITENSEKKVMSGTLVLLETFTGDTPQSIFG